MKVSQKSSGDGAKNILCENYHESAARKAAIETLSIMKVIRQLSNLAKDISEFKDSEKDMNKKLQRFSTEHQLGIKKDYQNLACIYGVIYEEAIHQSALPEITTRKIAAWLSYRSREELEKNMNNPIISLANLTSEILEDLRNADSKEEYDQVAIRFYLLKELIKCNVFPNPDEL